LSRSDRARGATIVDVAQRAGVSRMTVSRVINNDAKRSGSDAQAVLAAIHELNYEPNLTARNLVMAGELRIAVIYSNPSAAFMSDFLIGVFEEATSAGARLILVRGENGQAPRRRNCAGCWGAACTAWSWPRLWASPPSFATFSARPICPRLWSPAGASARPTRSTYASTTVRPAQAMARHLLDLGHRRIGFIAGNPDQTASAERLDGRAGGRRGGRGG
jgi:LacI family transcriptional regulator